MSATVHACDWLEHETEVKKTVLLELLVVEGPQLAEHLCPGRFIL